MGSSYCGAVETNPTRNHEVTGSIPGLTRGLSIQHCHELWCRSQMWLGSCDAVALRQAADVAPKRRPQGWEPLQAWGEDKKRKERGGGGGCVPINLSGWTFKFEFCINFHMSENITLFIFFPTLENKHS